MSHAIVENEWLKRAGAGSTSITVPITSLKRYARPRSYYCRRTYRSAPPLHPDRRENTGPPREIFAGSALPYREGAGRFPTSVPFVGLASNGNEDSLSPSLVPPA